jgi:putative heme degradation protein
MFRPVSQRVPKNSPPVESTIFVNNPLVASVLRENVIVRDRKAFISLWSRWDAVLELIYGFGSVLSIGRNSHAVLGKIGRYPKVFCAPCGHCAAASDGTSEFYFGKWHRAEVSIEEKTGGWLYAVEFFDAWEETLHKICLTADSDFETFCEWVELNQATNALEEINWSAERDGCSAVTTPPPGEGAAFLRPEALERFFGSLIEEEYPVQIVVGNDSFVQGADLKPISLRTNDQWIFVSDEKNGLHLRTGQLAEVCVQRVAWGDNASNLVLKAYEPEGRLACVLAPPRESTAPHWDDFLEKLIRPFQIQVNEP